MLHKNAVPEHRDIRGGDDHVVVELWRFEDDVVGLPFTWLACHVHEWWVLAVNRRGLAIGVGHVLVRIQHLHLVAVHESDAAVAAILAEPASGSRRGEFDVQLNVAKLLPRDNRTRSRTGLEVAVLDRPRRIDQLAVLRMRPLRQILAIEEKDRVGGRCPWGGAGRHHARMRTGRAVNAPRRAGDLREPPETY